MRPVFVFWISAALLAGTCAPGNTQTTAVQNETAVLQQRLLDAGCYKGPIDGKPGAAVEAARKACPDQSPKLRIETGTHLAGVQAISVDGRCTRAVTGSDDKTIRLWSLPEGTLLRTIRLPIGDGDEGKVYAVALSPDGNSIAVGGWDAQTKVDGKYGITLLSLNGASVRRLGPFANVVNRLEFSPDGRRIAAVLGGSDGLRVLDVATGKETDLSAGYSKDTYGLAFGSDGSIYTSSYDDFIRYYDAQLQLKAKVKAKGANPFSVALSPDGRRLAVGFPREARVDLYSAISLDPLQSLDVGGTNASLAQVVWTSDGGVHAAGGFDIATDGKRRAALRSWDQKGNVRKPDRPVSNSNNTITDLRACGETVAFASAGNSFGLIGSQGPARDLGISAATDMRGKRGNNFKVSADGRQIFFGLGQDAIQPILFDLTKASVADAGQPPQDLFPPLTEGLEVAGWNYEYNTTFGGQRIPLDDYERSRALSVRHDRKGFILGTNFWLRAYDNKGVERSKVSPKPVPGSVWGVDLTPDDRILVTATSDGTIRWYRADDLTELLALFVDVRDRRWIAWTPSGYYIASAGGEDLIGWHFNRGWQQEAIFYPAAQFRDRFSRPDIVQLVLKTLDEGRAVREADEVRARNQQLGPNPPPPAALAAALPPQIVILSPKDGDRFSSDSIDVNFQLRSPLGQSITQLQWQVDTNPARTVRVKLADGSEDTRTIALPKQNVTLSLSASVGSLSSDPVRVKLIYEGDKPAVKAKPNLYLLAIGVDDYDRKDEFPQTHAGAGIDAMIATWKKQEGRQFGKVIPFQLLDSAQSKEKLTLERIREVFDRLAAVEDNDLVVLYVVGHGFVDTSQKFHLMLRGGDLGRLRTTSLSRSDILDPLLEIRGRKLVLIESCHAASAMEQTSGAARYSMDDVLNEFRDRAQSPYFVVMGAAQAFQLARFDQRWNYRGAFTQALVDALEGKAADKEGRVSVLSLYRYLNETIPGMTSSKQNPSIVPPLKDISDFPLASIR